MNLLCCLVCILTFLFSAADVRAGTPENKIVGDNNPKEILAKVNGTPIYRQDLNYYLAAKRKARPQTRAGQTDRQPTAAEKRAEDRQRRQAALESLIDRELMYREALKRGLVVSESQIEVQWKTALDQLARGGPPDVPIEQKLAKSGYTEEQYKSELRKESLVRKLRQTLTPKPEDIKDDEIKACYKEYKNRFWSPPKVRFRELLVALPRIAGKSAVDRAYERVNVIKKRLDSGADFKDLVRECSDARSARVGGETGWKTRKELGNQAADLAFSLKPGEIGGPIKTSTGLVMIQLIEKQDGRYYSVDESRNSIIKFLQRRHQDNNMKKLAAKLRKAAEIEYIVRP